MSYKRCRLLFCLCLFLFCTGLKAQHKGGSAYARQTRTIVHYSFTGASSLEQVDSLAAEIYLKLPEVAHFKARFKPENKHAEITLLVVENFPDPEARNTFDAAKLKVIIINHGFEPLDLTEYISDK
ncbi:MAG: hypothetical protein ACHQRM_05970 [Bacteroidia bacterium]